MKKLILNITKFNALNVVDFIFLLLLLFGLFQYLLYNLGIFDNLFLNINNITNNSNLLIIDIKIILLPPNIK